VGTKMSMPKTRAVSPSAACASVAYGPLRQACAAHHLWSWPQSVSQRHFGVVTPLLRRHQCPQQPQPAMPGQSPLAGVRIETQQGRCGPHRASPWTDHEGDALLRSNALPRRRRPFPACWVVVKAGRRNFQANPKSAPHRREEQRAGGCAAASENGGGGDCFVRSAGDRQPSEVRDCFRRQRHLHTCREPLPSPPPRRRVAAAAVSAAAAAVASVGAAGSERKHHRQSSPKGRQRWR
jgi:hypothetical protein